MVANLRLAAKVTIHGRILPLDSTNSRTSCYFSALVAR